MIHFTWNHIGVAAQLCQDLSVAWSPHQLSLSPPPFKMLSGRSDVGDDVENWKNKFCLGKKYIFVVMIRADANKGVTHCGGISGHLAPRKLYIVTIFTKGLISQIERWVKYFFFSEEFMPISLPKRPFLKNCWVFKNCKSATDQQDLKFVKKFTRPNSRAKEFYTLKTRQPRLFSPAINSEDASLSVIWPSFG